VFKVIFIAALLGILIFFIVRRLGFVNSRPTTYLHASDWLEVRIDTRTLKRAVRQTLFSVGIGFVLLILILLVTAKFKIALLLLPISLYLIGQYFILFNHIKANRRQQIFFNPKSNEVEIQSSKGQKEFSFNLNRDVSNLREIRAVQKNNGLLLGYYEMKTMQGKLFISYLLEENEQNKLFFDRLQLFPREMETKLFPII